MSPDFYRIEVATLELARSSNILSFLSQPECDDARVEHLLLAVISSRVRWEVAQNIVGRLIDCFRVENNWHSYDVSASTLRSITAGHRHPVRTARWISELLADDGRLAKEAVQVAVSNLPLKLIRRKLIEIVPGLGPKQSSLLLRNLGRGQHLAVLDRHIMRFMSILGLTNSADPPSSMNTYEQIEEAFLTYAGHRNVVADALDMAAWIVMRSAREGPQT